MSFLPAFWLLVPGALSLIGVTKLAAGASGGTDVATALFTVVAIAFGVVTGSAIDAAISRRFVR